MSGEGVISARRKLHNTRLKRGSIICPKCNASAGIHGGDHVTPLVKEIYCRCTNVTCGLTWKAQIAFVHVISPSAIAGGPDLPPPPAGFKPTIYPAGPPGTPPDPGQLAMFGSDDGEGEAARATA